MSRTYGKAQDLIDFTRASSGTALRRVKYGAELVTNGTFDSDVSGWSSIGSISVVGQQLYWTNTNIGGAYTTIATEAGKVYRFTFDLTVGSGSIRFSPRSETLSGTQLASIYLSTGSNTIDVVADGSAIVLYIQNLTATEGEFYLDNVSAKETIFDTSDGDLILFNHPTNIPRIEYDSDGNRLGLLVEESRTNLVAPSSDFDAAFVAQTGVNVSSAYGISPDGTVNADKLVADTSTGFHRIAKTAISTSSGVDYSYSCFFKAAGETVAGLGLFDGVNWLGRASVDLTTGVASVSNGSAKVDDFGDGWYRLTVYGTSLGTSHTAYIYVKSLFSSAGGNGTDGVLAYGAQVEQGSFPTSYIPTSGSTATRSADVASIGVSEFGYNQSAGTMVVEARNSENCDVLALIDDGSTNNRIRLYESGSNVVGLVSVNSTNVAVMVTSQSVSVDSLKSAIAAKKDDFAVVANGGSVFPDTAGDMPSNLTSLKVATPETGGAIGAVHIKSIKYYPRRLTNAQLVQLTS